MFEISLWDNDNGNITANIEIITNEKMIPLTQHHEHKQIIFR